MGAQTYGEFIMKLYNEKGLMEYIASNTLNVWNLTEEMDRQTDT